MKRNLILFLSLFSVIIFSCSKELSLENADNPSEASLQKDITSECLPKTVSGSYVAGEALTDQNYIDVEVNVTTPGSYTIQTDTVNGYAFKAEGVFSDAGLKTVRLTGRGTPLSDGNNLFVVSLDTSFCLVQVVVLPAGGGGPASFTLQGSGGDCLNYTVNGNYVAGTALGSSNTVLLNVNVTTIGTYNIFVPAANGITFSGSGTLGNTGNQTITLTATGTPVTAETTTFSVTAGSSTCSFDVDVTATATGGDYYPMTANSNWTYAIDGDTNDTLLKIATNVTISAMSQTWNVFGQTTDLAQGVDSGGYYRKAGSDYYEYLDFGAFFGLDNEVWNQYIMLKDDQPVASTWNSGSITGTQGTNSFTLRIKSTITQKDVSVTVLGNAYANTIVVEERVEADAGGGNWTDISSVTGYIKSYYSRGVGLIKREYFDGAGTLDTRLELTRYQVL